MSIDARLCHFIHIIKLHKKEKRENKRWREFLKAIKWFNRWPLLMFKYLFIGMQWEIKDGLLSNVHFLDLDCIWILFRENCVNICLFTIHILECLNWQLLAEIVLDVVDISLNYDYLLCNSVRIRYRFNKYSVNLIISQ